MVICFRLSKLPPTRAARFLDTCPAWRFVEYRI
jgi:hypothetical protein